MEDAEKVIKEHGKEIDIVAFLLHITDTDVNVNYLNIDDNDKKIIIRIIQDSNRNECDRYFEINDLINKKYSKPRDIIMWGLDVSRIYRSGIGLVI